MIQQAVGGLVSGGVFAALAVCIVLMYRMLGVLNFALAAMGGLGACASLYTYGDRGWGTLPAVVVGLLAGALLGAILGLVMARWFVEASVEIRSTVTIGLLVTALAVGNRILGGSAHKTPDLLGSGTVQIGGIGIATGSLIEAGGALLMAVALTAYLRATKTGTQLRALSVRPTTAQLMGVPVGRLTVAVWAFSSFVATLAVLFVLPSSTSDFSNLALLILSAMAAALVGLLRSMAIAAIAGIAIGMLQSMALYWDSIARYSQAIPFVVITIAMMWWRRGDVWAEAR
jgi:branched-chain amino acid transport system permease protein